MPGGDAEKETTFGAAVKTILWSFFGVRRRARHESETVRLKPSHIVLTGLVAAAVFVVVLVTLARLVVRTAGG